MDADLWVFGYGSLMWQPGFPFAERLTATVHGYHRALCIYSYHYRGTEARPGLVLGLDRGGSCQGVAFRVAAAEAPATLAYLRVRELVTNVYREVLLPARLSDGRHVTALAYVADRAHAQYAHGLSPAEIEALVGSAVGVAGSDRDYVCNTQAHLAAIGIRDRMLERLARSFAAPADGRGSDPPPAADAARQRGRRQTGRAC
jgi:cation transport protein ChaC